MGGVPVILHVQDNRPQLLAPKTGQEIRGRADESAQALANVFEYVVLALRSRLQSDGIRLVSTLIAHSEGNYMVMKGAEAISEYTALPRQEAFDIEYWSLEAAKLRRMPPESELSRRIVAVATNQ